MSGDLRAKTREVKGEKKERLSFPPGVQDLLFVQFLIRIEQYRSCTASISRHINIVGDTFAERFTV